MQVHSFSSESSPQTRLYNRDGMAKRLKKARPKQGMHLAELRKAAGFSQYDLARVVGVPQPNIAYWEYSEKPPRSDVLPKMAEALGVRVEELLNGGAQLAAARTRKGGPTGKVRKVFEQVSKLPRRQQEKVVEFVSAFVEHYQQK